MYEISTLTDRGEQCVSAFVELCDIVFLREKGRSGTLAQRYAKLFRVANWRNLYAVWVDGQLVGTAAAHEFECLFGGKVLHGAMVGLVAIRKDFRGQGIGKHLMRFVSDDLLRRPLNFAVLWTATPNFYMPLGWIPSDTGMFGQLSNSISETGHRGFLTASADFDFVESVRRTHLTDQIRRNPEDYSVIPCGVDDVLCFRSERHGKNAAYALVGVKNDSAVIYEIVGNVDCYDEIWDAIISRFASISANDCSGSRSLQWFQEKTPLKWRCQNLSLWLTCDTSESLRKALPYVPYFDRI